MTLTMQSAEFANSAAPVITPDRPDTKPRPDQQPIKEPAGPNPLQPHPLTRPPGIKPDENPRPKARGGLTL